ncbi:adiponectin isoform X2 [Ambystoma mexicanum]|uniref:adiponectin isoform X2 n=1 Tax=Ambystoma mexicanum TaxID=8296 RepID=UPI0037E745B8
MQQAQTSETNEEFQSHRTCTWLSMKFFASLVVCLLLVAKLGHAEKYLGELQHDDPSSKDPSDTQGPRGPCANWMGGAPGYPGHNGVAGRDGRDGKDGEKGEKGEQGEQGSKGDEGAIGPTGAEGAQGLPGTSGLKGEKGEGSFMHQSAFSVGLQNRAPPPNMPIKFTKIFYNEQKHYDESTGKFTCVIPGTYFFSYHLTVYLKDVKVSLYKSEKPIMFTFDQFQANNVDQASGSVLLHLKAGEEIWLQVYGEEIYNGIYADNVNDSTFMGVLLYPDMSQY